MIRKSLVRRLFLPVTAALAAMAFVAPVADALVEHPYGNVLLQPSQQYQGPISQEMTGNIALYSGSGQISVCESVSVYGGGVVQKSCGLNGAGNALNVQSWHGEWLVGYIQNASSNAHTIKGVWYSLRSWLSTDETLQGGEKLESPNLQYRASMQTDGNFVVYNNSSGKVCWHSNSNGHPGNYAIMQRDGNFVVYGAGVPVGGTPSYFNTGTNGKYGSYIKMQNDGNLVLYNLQNQPIWATSWITGKLGC